jgi:carbamoyl-phosphate synthase large subunit
MRVAVTGLSRGENPQPGAGIVAGIRAAYPEAFVVGLVYDAMESGIYAEGGPDAVFTMPYPTVGAPAYLRRLDEARAAAPFDVFIPTLDSELDLIVNLEDELRERGLKTCLPHKAAFRRRMKDHLPELAAAAGVATPETRAVFTSTQAFSEAVDMGFPLIVKGAYYDAQKVSSPAQLAGAVTSLLAQWGAPVLLQKAISGAEFDALGIGDGKGGITGLCCIRKTIVSSKGKGLGGVTVRDPALRQLCEKLIRELKWRGPFEIEVMKDESDGTHCLIEINPRFPAWVDFPARFGLNFAAALAQFAESGEVPRSMPEPEPGWFYLRHQVEVLGRMQQLASLSGAGECAMTPVEPTSVNSRHETSLRHPNHPSSRCGRCEPLSPWAHQRVSAD